MSTASSTPSIFDSFNARFLEPHEVARTFVPPRHYSQLVKRTHSLIIGPRGSGKTTLLKMLQGAALEAWTRPQAEPFRSRVDFTGVFVPTDVSWNSQVAALGRGHLSPEHQRLFSVATFTTHVLRQLVAAMLYRVHPPSDPSLIPHRRVSLQTASEALLVQETASSWDLHPSLPSLSALRRSLTQRLADLAALAAVERHRGQDGRDERLASLRYLHLSFRDSAAVAIDIFDDVAAERRARWAFLFDELELAPSWIREDLITSLRSVDDRFLFKLSTSPFTEDIRILDHPQGAMPGNDFEPIPLWYPRKETGYSFCRALLESMLQGYRVTAGEQSAEVDPVKLFGRSEFETEHTEWMISGTAYSPGSRLQDRFLRLAAKDQTFRDYLRANDIDPHKLHEILGDARAAEIRKITSIVAVRDAFRGPDHRRIDTTLPIVRSRKNPELYRGAASLFAIVEGNPRWFIGIVGTLLREHYYDRLPVSASAQASEISKAANRFRALLRTIPCAAGNLDSQLRGVLSLLDPIGRYLFKSVVVDDFNPEPPGSFIVDTHTGQSLLDSLGRALNAGAIVYVPDEDSQMALGSLRGKRFRLSYLLATYYRIPIRLGREVSLSHILRSQTPNQDRLKFSD